MINQLVDPATAQLQPASISLSLNGICNNAHSFVIQSTGGGLQTSAGATPGFSNRVDYSASVLWGGASSSLQTSGAAGQSSSHGRGAGGVRRNAAAANRGCGRRRERASAARRRLRRRHHHNLQTANVGKAPPASKSSRLRAMFGTWRVMSMSIAFSSAADRWRSLGKRSQATRN